MGAGYRLQPQSLREDLIGLGRIWLRFPQRVGLEARADTVPRNLAPPTRELRGLSATRRSRWPSGFCLVWLRGSYFQMAAGESAATLRHRRGQPPERGCIPARAQIADGTRMSLGKGAARGSRRRPSAASLRLIRV